MDDSLLTPNQVARLLSLQPSTIYAAAARGQLLCVRLWKGERRTLIRFRREDIERIIEERSSRAEPRTG